VRDFALGTGAVVLLGVGAALWLLRPRAAPIVEYAMPRRADVPAAITAAPNGTIWFTIDGSDALGVVRDGRLEQVSRGSRGIDSIGIAVEPGGAVWYTDEQRASITRLAPDGTAAEFPLGSGIARLGRLAADPDGGVWFADYTANAITHLRDGVFTPHVIPTDNAGPFGVGLAATGEVWFTESYVSKLGRLGRDGRVVEFETPTRNSQPTDLVVDASGAVWFIEVRANKIGRFAEGAFSEYPVPTAQSGLASLAVADDGAVWFAELRGQRLGRLRDGVFTEFSLPSKDARPLGVTTTGDGSVWYTDLTGRVGRLPPEVARSR
jgi:virginiamycin B lyase